MKSPKPVLLLKAMASSTLCLCVLLGLQAAGAQSIQSPGAPSIREQLEGSVEKRDEDPDLKRGSADSSWTSGALNYRKLDSEQDSNSLKNGLDYDSTLRGKVEERDRLEKLGRLNADPLGKSVRVLSGQSYSNALEGSAENDSLDSVLSADHFNLPMQKMTPKTDYNALSNTTGYMQSGRGRGSALPEFAWGIKQYFPDDWGYGNRFYDEEYFYYYRNQLPGINWDNRWFERQRLRADLVRGPNLYQRMPDVVAPVAPMSRNINWGIRPMSMPPPAYSEQNILWDAWYQRISQELYRNWKGRGNEPGIATLRITILRGRKIEAQIVKTNNHSASFKKGLMDAVATLSGSAVLDFPSMSQKQIVSFDSAFTASTSTANGATSERKGDIEQVRIRR